MTDLTMPGNNDAIEQVQMNEMVCPNCRLRYLQGFTTCSDCRIPLVSELPGPEPCPQSDATTISTLTCQQHPEIGAIAQCRACGSGICGTCDFHISGLHFCPKCIDSAPNERINPRRKRMAIWAIACAGYCTLMVLFTFTGLLYWDRGSANQLILGSFLVYGMCVPSLIGTGLAFSAFERRFKNTHLIWTALLWNGSLMALGALFTAVPLLAKFLGALKTSENIGVTVSLGVALGAIIWYWRFRQKLSVNMNIVPTKHKEPTTRMSKSESRPIVRCPECGAPTFDMARHRHIWSIPDRK